MFKRDFIFFALGALIAATLTAIANHAQEIERAAKKRLRVYRLNDDDGGSPIKFHPHDKPPKNAKRIWPPIHAGGRPAENEIDRQALALIEEGFSISEAWDMAIQDTYPKVVLGDTFFMRGEYNRFKRRIKYQMRKLRC